MKSARGFQVVSAKNTDTGSCRKDHSHGAPERARPARWQRGGWRPQLRVLRQVPDVTGASSRKGQSRNAEGRGLRRGGRGVTGVENLRTLRTLRCREREKPREHIRIQNLYLSTLWLLGVTLLKEPQRRNGSCDLGSNVFHTEALSSLWPPYRMAVTSCTLETRKLRLRRAQGIVQRRATG